MANLKSAQKQARQNIKHRDRNLARKTSIKTSAKKLLAAIENKESAERLQELFREVQVKLARAGNKGVLHKKTASRKISRLAKRVAQASATK
jgi:small subunit ribosomal protein S20